MGINTETESDRKREIGNSEKRCKDKKKDKAEFVRHKGKKRHKQRKRWTDETMIESCKKKYKQIKIDKDR